jgi:hypothetical protein
LAEYRDEYRVRFTAFDRVTSPFIREVLWTIFKERLIYLEVRNFLVHHNLIGSPLSLPPYYEFARRVYTHIHRVGYSNSVPLVQADINEFAAQGFPVDVLRSLALLQGLTV